MEEPRQNPSRSLNTNDENREDNLFNDIHSKMKNNHNKGDTLIDVENTVNLINVEKEQNNSDNSNEAYGKRKRSDSFETFKGTEIRPIKKRIKSIKQSDSDSNSVGIGEAIETLEFSNSTNNNITPSDCPEKNKSNKPRRRRGTDTYAQKTRQIKRNSGEKYYTGNGKIVNEKKFENKDCQCLKKCINLITADERRCLFEEFWNLADFNKQNMLLYGATQRCDVQRKRLRNRKGNPRSCSFKYYLNTSSERILVCRQFFLDTYNVSVGRLHRAVNASIPGLDMRGRMAGSSRKTSDEDIAAVKNHIQSFSAFPSHCAKAHHEGKKYLNPDLNITKMFNMYVEKSIENNLSHVNEWIYRKIFNKEFNLDFHHPCKDACEKCETFNTRIKASRNIEEKIIKIKKNIYIASTS